MKIKNYRVAKGLISRNPREEPRKPRSFEVCASLTADARRQMGIPQDFERQVAVALTNGCKPLQGTGVVVAATTGHGPNIYAAQVFDGPAEKGDGNLVVEYKLVVSENENHGEENFSANVEKALEEGWELLGGLACTEDPDRRICLAQALFRHPCGK